MTKDMDQSSMSSDDVSSDNDWQKRLAHIVNMMREISRHTNPQEMVLAYAKRIGEILPTDRLVAISRRHLDRPQYRVTRSTTWGLDRNPWHHMDKLPVFDRGLMGELLYSDEPRIFDDLTIRDDDPAAEFLRGMRSVMAIPVYEQGMALNMTLLMRRQPNAFDRSRFADQVWTTNLFGRATQTLVLSQQVQDAYHTVDQEMKLIGDLQRSLLPKQLPVIPTMDLAVHYQPATRSGGDYYDFFPMADDSWGIIMADVSGHGSPATVLMAVTHALAHTNPRDNVCPAQMLQYINEHLTRRYTGDTGRFVTAFFGVYQPSSRQMTYACAGHNPPRLKRCSDGSMFSIDGVGNPPLGITPNQTYDQTTQNLTIGDQIIFYTDGITEAFNAQGDMFGLERLDLALANCMIDASGLIGAVLAALSHFTSGHEATDDRTMLVAKIV